MNFGLTVLHDYTPVKGSPAKILTKTLPGPPRAPAEPAYMKTHFRTIMISDVHLASRDSQAARLSAFLHEVKCDRLYIVGDFFDIWQMRRKWHWDASYNDVIRRIMRMANKGTEVVFIPGNHDEGLREYNGMEFGNVRIALKDEFTSLSGKRLLVTHGDEFDAVVVFHRWLANVGSAAYDWLLVANRGITMVRGLFGLPPWSLAAYAKRRVKNAGVYIERFQRAAAHAAREGGFDGIICGHLHTACLKDYEGLTYCNLGDWVDSCTALVETDDGELKIISADQSPSTSVGTS